MRRTLSLLVLVGLITLEPASSANAGGWDSLVFPVTTTSWAKLQRPRSGSSPASYEGRGRSMGASITRTSCLEVPRMGDWA